MNKKLTKMNKCIKHKYSYKYTGEIIDQCTEMEGCEITDKICEGCSMFDSKYIEFPIEVQSINNKVQPEKQDKKCGKPVIVTLNKKIYKGIYLGEEIVSTYISYNIRKHELELSPLLNPVMYVPELKKKVRGLECNWRFELEE